MIFHVVTGDAVAELVRHAIAGEPSMAGEVTAIKDGLHLGPLKRLQNQKFSDMRTDFRREMLVNDKLAATDDLERLLETGNELSRNPAAVIWIWMAPLAADVCSYYRALTLLRKYLGRLFIVNIANLPFLDENGKVFYPASIAALGPGEIIKARKLARPVTASEAENDCDEWRLREDENGRIRLLEGGKRLVSKPANFYDNNLKSCCNYQFQKASRIIAATISKYEIPVGDAFLGWRLRTMAESGILEIQGEHRSPKDFEVRLP